MGTKIYASTTTAPLYEKFDNPVSKAVQSAVFKGNKRILTSLVEEAINGIHLNMQRFYEYGRDKYVLGLPEGGIEMHFITTAHVESVIQAMENNQAVIEKVFPQTSLDRFFIWDYLVSNHGYLRYDSTVTSAPQTTLDAAQQDANTFETVVAAEFETVKATLRAQLPADRVEETRVMRNGVEVTEVKEYRYPAKEKERFIPDTEIQSIFTRYVPVVEDNTAKYRLEFETTLKQRVRYYFSIQYHEEVTTYYRHSGNTTTPTKSLNYNVPRINSGNVVQSNFNSYSFEDTFTPDYDKGKVYVYAEYHLLDSEGNKVPKHILTDNVNGLAPDAGLPQTTFVQKLSEDSYCYPVVPIIKKGFNLYEGEHIDAAVNAINPEIFDRIGQDVLSNPDNQYDGTTMDEILSLLSIKASDLVNAIYENPDIDEVDEAYLMLAVNLRSDEQAGVRYLYEFFNRVYEFTPPDERIQIEASGNFDLMGLNYNTAIHIRNGDVDIDLLHYGIGKRLVSGRIARVGDAQKEVVLSDFDEGSSRVYFRLQNTEDTYTEIVVKALQHRATVYENGYIQTSLTTMMEDEDNNNFLIPIEHSIVQIMPLYLRQALFHQTPMLVFHSYEKVKTKWYESGVFKVALVIVSAVIFIYTGVDTFSTFLSIAAASGAAAAITFLLVKVATAIAIKKALEYVVEAIGFEAAFVIALATFLAFGYGKISDVSEILTVSPDTLLQLSAGISEAIQTNIQKDLLELQNEISAFSDELEGLEAELERVKELLDTGSLIDPFNFIDSPVLIYPQETPADYFQRKLNVSISDIQPAIISNYTEIALTLPKQLPIN